MNTISVKKIIINKPATIIYFSDGSKTVVKCSKNDTWDTEKGIMMAFAKRAMGNPKNFHEILERMVHDAEHPVKCKKTTNHDLSETDKKVIELLERFVKEFF